MNGDLDQSNHFKGGDISNRPLVEKTDTQNINAYQCNQQGNNNLSNTSQQLEMVNQPSSVNYEPPQSAVQPEQQKYYQGQQAYQPNNNQAIPIIINTQISPTYIQMNDPSFFKTVPVLANCMSCRNIANTRIQGKFGWLNYCCYFCFGPVLWVIFQAARGKDISCMDTDHFCHLCGNHIYSYKAC